MTIKRSKWIRIAKRTGIVLGVVLLYALIHFAANRFTAAGRRLSFASVEQTVASSPNESITLLSYNMAHLRGPTHSTHLKDLRFGDSRSEKEERLQEIKRSIEAVRPDIVVLNEIDFCSYWTGHRNHAEWLAEQLKLPHVAEQRNIDVSLPFVSIKHGNAVLSRFPIQDIFPLAYPQASTREEMLFGKVKYGCVCRMLVDGQQLDIVPIHLEHRSEPVRLESVEMIADFHRRSGVEMIAVGDFNSLVRDGVPTAITELHGEPEFQLAVDITNHDRHVTFRNPEPDKKIDWLFFTSGIQVREEQVLDWQMSDHRPILATFEFRQNANGAESADLP